MGARLRAAPVFFTIAQVRFNPILSLEAYAPQIQERLRKEGLPDAQKGLLATINLNLNAACPLKAAHHNSDRSDHPLHVRKHAADI